jgi:hypothetical protein
VIAIFTAGGYRDPGNGRRIVIAVFPPVGTAIRATGGGS